MCRPTTDYTSYTCRCPAGWQGMRVYLWDTEFFCVCDWVCWMWETECLNAKSQLILCISAILWYINISLFAQVNAAMTMWMNAKRILAKMVAVAWTAKAATRVNVNLDTADTTVRQTLTTAHPVSFKLVSFLLAVHTKGNLHSYIRQLYSLRYHWRLEISNKPQ